jgi:hypothetical protein
MKNYDATTHEHEGEFAKGVSLLLIMCRSKNHHGNAPGED